MADDRIYPGGGGDYTSLPSKEAAGTGNNGVMNASGDCGNTVYNNAADNGIVLYGEDGSRPVADMSDITVSARITSGGGNGILGGSSLFILNLSMTVDGFATSHSTFFTTWWSGVWFLSQTSTAVTWTAKNMWCHGKQNTDTSNPMNPMAATSNFGAGNTTLHIYNHRSVVDPTGIVSTSPDGGGIWCNRNEGTLVDWSLENCSSHSHGRQAYAIRCAGGTEKLTNQYNCVGFGGFTADFINDVAPTNADTNASGDTSAPGTTTFHSLTDTDHFTDTTYDFTLKSGSDLLDAGTARGAVSELATDALGTSRPQGSGWDIGAIELEVADLEPPCDRRKADRDDRIHGLLDRCWPI